MIRWLDAGIRHVNVPVLDHQRALWVKEVLQAEPSLRSELKTAAELRDLRIESGVQNARGRIQEGYHPPVGLAVQPEDKGVPGHATTRVNGVTEESFIDNLEAVHRKASIRPVFYYEP